MNIADVLEYCKNKLDLRRKLLEVTKDFRGEFIAPNIFKQESIDRGVIIINALEKQMPKKVYEKEKSRGIDVSGEIYISYNMICHCCGIVVGDHTMVRNTFCHNCGQKLDWSVIDE